MKMAREINAYCPWCNKHTPHTVKMYSKGTSTGQDMGTRRAERKRKGYVGKVKGKATVKKLAKRQKVILVCKECKHSVERVIGSRTKKKLEFKVE